MLAGHSETFTSLDLLLGTDGKSQKPPTTEPCTADTSFIGFHEED